MSLKRIIFPAVGPEGPGGDQSVPSTGPRPARGGIGGPKTRPSPWGVGTRSSALAPDGGELRKSPELSVRVIKERTEAVEGLEDVCVEPAVLLLHCGVRDKLRSRSSGFSLAVLISLSGVDLRCSRRNPISVRIRC